MRDESRVPEKDNRESVSSIFSKIWGKRIPHGLHLRVLPLAALAGHTFPLFPLTFIKG